MANSNPWQGSRKRTFDLAVLAIAHVLLAPLWLLLWTVIPALIWLQDRGPIFYYQNRVGLGGDIFRIRKFRTMRDDAEQDSGATWATQDDPRITPVGRLLRATALDELPQVLNILQGDMSFVGPRAERPELYVEFAAEIPGFEQRLAIKPGLAGLAQLHGAYDLSPKQKLQFDLEYMERMGPWTDMKIMLLSVANTLRARWDHRGDTK